MTCVVYYIYKSLCVIPNHPNDSVSKVLADAAFTDEAGTLRQICHTPLLSRSQWTAQGERCRKPWYSLQCFRCFPQVGGFQCHSSCNSASFVGVLSELFRFGENILPTAFGSDHWGRGHGRRRPDHGVGRGRAVLRAWNALGFHLHPRARCSWAESVFCLNG